MSGSACAPVAVSRALNPGEGQAAHAVPNLIQNHTNRISRYKGGGGFHGLRVRQEVVQHIVLINHLYKTNYSISCSLLRQARLVTALSEALGTM